MARCSYQLPASAGRQYKTGYQRNGAMALEETWSPRKERRYSDHPFHGRPRSSGKTLLSPRQYCPQSKEVGFFLTCFELSRYVWYIALRGFPPYRANSLYNLLTR